MIEIPEKQSILENVMLGVGTWAWGDRLVWGFGRSYTVSDVRQALISERVTSLSGISAKYGLILVAKSPW